MWQYILFLLGKPVVAKPVTKAWHHRYWRPRRLTLGHNPAIYRWLFWNFSWDPRCVGVRATYKKGYAMCFEPVRDLKTSELVCRRLQDVLPAVTVEQVQAGKVPIPDGRYTRVIGVLLGEALATYQLSYPRQVAELHISFAGYK